MQNRYPNLIEMSKIISKKGLFEKFGRDIYLMDLIESLPKITSYEKQIISLKKRIILKVFKKKFRILNLYEYKRINKINNSSRRNK